MLNKPLLSIVTSIYNSKDRLKLFLDCISNQTYENIEVIIIDDCSTDKQTLEIEKQLLEKTLVFNKKFTFVKNKKNLGLLKSFQKGLNLAKGEFIAFPESDDYIDKNFYKIGMDYLLKYNSDVVKGLMLYKYLNSEKIDLKPEDTKYDNEFSAFNIDLDYTTSWYYIFNRKILTKNKKKPCFLNAILYASCRDLYLEYKECVIPPEVNSYYICYSENKKHENLTKEWKYFIKQLKINIIKYINDYK